MTMIFQHPSEQTTDFQPIAVDLLPGRYLLECWGAQGGTGRTNSELYYHGGRGAYASGILDLREQTTFHLYIGTKGEDGPNNHQDIAYGGWNGGGNGGRDTNNAADLPDASGAGGGATDIRLVRAPDGQEAEDETSLDSRIIVAAGGSGSVNGCFGAPGGDLTGYKVTARDTESYAASDTNQEAGNRKGQGGNGKEHVHVPSSGAGGGYFGGKASEGSGTNYYTTVSSSGSSYVSGYPGCSPLTISQASVFNDVLFHTRIFNGFSSFPSVDYETTKKYETGHEGNGAIKITYLKTCTIGINNRRHSNIFIYVAIVIMNQNNSE